MPTSFLLSELPLEVRARVAAIEVEGAVGQRLWELGFRVGAEVTCRRRAPLGDPRVYELAGSQVCLRRSEAVGIRVELDG